MFLTPEQLNEIKEIIKDYHDAFILNAIGLKTLAPHVVKRLQEKGLIDPQVNSIEDAYLFGQILAITESKKVADMSYNQFKDYLRKNPVPLTEAEKQAVQFASIHAGQYCQGLGNRVDIYTGDTLIEADARLRARMETEIRTKTAENIAKRETVKQLKTDLGWATKDWARDWDRIAVTEKQTAMQEGVADGMRKEHGDPWVSKIPQPEACSRCKDLHISKEDGHPYIFKLSTLEEHGTNVGRKRADWRPVVGTVHPNCQCQLVRVPNGWGYDEEGILMPGAKGGIKYEDAQEMARAIQRVGDLQKALRTERRITFQNIPIVIENPVGSVRKWKTPEGETGETTFFIAYGYIAHTQGMDGDEIDVFVGPDPQASMVYLIEQMNPATGIYDEQKCMLGFANSRDAQLAYKRHYDSPKDFIITVEEMDLDQFKRWIAATVPQPGELAKNDWGMRYVLPVAETLIKAGRVGGKYIKRVPYTDKHGKRKYRYYYSESAIARDLQEGETVRVGGDLIQVEKVDPDGTVHLRSKDQTLKLKPDQWPKFISEFYGQAYYSWAEKRSLQSVNAVLRYVPEKLLGELKGKTDKERLADLKKRVPDVYAKLEKSFTRAGVNPFRAKQVIESSLERRGWEPKARAAVIGDVITKRNQDFRTTIRAAENLAGGKIVKLSHVAAVTEITKKYFQPEKDAEAAKPKAKRVRREKPAKAPPADPIAELASKAEKEIAKLSKLIEQAREGVADDAGAVLQAALSSTAIAQLNMIAKAFPGLVDRAVEPARQVMEQVASVAPTAEPRTMGSETSVFVAGEGGAPKRLAARYKLVEADQAIASHDPKSFNPRKDYPEGIQERAYHRDKGEQAKVVRNAQKFIPELAINTNPDAVNGPPIMSADGVVLGGNSRTMSMQLAYAKHPDRAEAIRQYLSDHAHEVGLSADDVKQFKNPILVRVVEEGGTTKEDKQLLVRQMNESFTQSMDPRTMQVAVGRKLTDSTIKELATAMNPDETLNEFLTTTRAKYFLDALGATGIIDQRNHNQYYTKGKLNADGKTLVSRVLVGRLVGDADLLSVTKPSVVENLARIVPYVEQAKSAGEAYSLDAELKMALDAQAYLQGRVDRGYISPLKADMPANVFDALFAQKEIGETGGEHPIRENPKAMKLLEVLIRRPGSKQITNVFRDYVEEAAKYPQGQQGMALMGAAKTPTEVFNEVMNRHLSTEKIAKPKKAETPEQETAGSLFALSLPVGDLQKGGPFIGPRGGKWADAKHTIPWKEEKKSPLIGLKLEIKPHEKMGMYDFTFHVVDAKDGKVRLSKDKDGEFGPWVPEESLSHLKNDLEGKVDLPARSKNETVNAVLDGKAEFLGKGDDGLAFRVGDKVVKVSTPVPYHPENNAYVTPQEAVEKLRAQAQLGNELSDIPGVQRSEFVAGHGKGFQIKDWVRIPKKFTREQLDKIQKTVIEIHKRGYAINDTIQPGLDKNGEPVLFDIGKAAKARGTGMMSDKESDMSNLSLLYRDSGEHFVRLDVDKTKQAWQHFEGMLKLYLETESFDYARKKLDKAVAKREKDIRARYKGEKLEEELDALEFDTMELNYSIEAAEEKAGKKIEKSLRKAGPFIGPKGGKWADSAHTIPWKENVPRKQIKEDAHDAVKEEVIEAAHKAIMAGADVESLKYVGAGAEGVIFKDNKNRVYKVARKGRQAERLRNEAEAAQSLEGTSAAKYVPKVHKYDKKHDVIVREHVEGEPGGWGTRGLREAYDVIAKELKSKNWSGSEYKEDSFIVQDGNIKMVDMGYIQPVGERGAARFEEVIQEKNPEKLNFLDIGFEISSLIQEGAVGKDKLIRWVDDIKKVVKTEGTEYGQFIDGLNFTAKHKGWGENLLQKAGPFIGPKGGKWADPEHTIPWEEGAGPRQKKQEEEPQKKPKREQVPGEKKEAKPKKAPPGSQLPEEQLKRLLELKVSKLPQADIPIADIKVDLEGDVDSKAILVWKDTKGAMQSGYTPKFHERNAKEKWERVTKFREQVPEVLKTFEAKLNSLEHGSMDHQGALLGAIIAKTGLRPGSVKSAQQHKHYGIVTLLPEHVSVNGDLVHFDFIGKAGKRNTATIQDETIAKHMSKYLEGKEGETPIFQSDRVIKAANKFIPKGMKVKDFRTIKATESAAKILESIHEPPPLTGNKAKDKLLLVRAIKEASTKVSEILNNTPAIARESYIHPEVLRYWAINRAGADPALLDEV